MRPAAFLAACCCLLAVVVASCAPAAAAASVAAPAPATATVTYRPPVDDPLVDPFRPPPDPFAAGNRGVDFASAPGTPVRAAADGAVVFAGQVGGSHHVVVLHADGLRTSYSFLATTSVRRGDRVRAGDVVGTAGGPVHWGVRAGDVYLDPLRLLGAGPPEVHLVPEHERRPGTERDERTGLVRLLGAVGRAGRATAGAVGWAGHRAVDASGTVAQYVRGQATAKLEELRGWQHDIWSTTTALNPVYVAWDTGGAVLSWYRARDDCTPADRAPPPLGERHLLVEVAGLGSHTDDDPAHPARAGAVAEVDAAALGYRDDDVIEFSYRGGTTEEHPYEAADTLGDLEASAAKLRTLLWRVRAEHPGVPVDIVAHSMGGVVTRLALGSGDLTLDSRLPPLGAVVTIGTPHDGADLATLAVMWGNTALGRGLELGVGRVDPGGLDPTAPAVAQLAETSPVLRELNSRALPTGVRFTSIAGVHDWVVPSGHAHLDGAQNVVISDGNVLTQHGTLPGSDEAGREIALALGGLAPTCQSLAGAVAASVEGRMLERAEDAVGFAGNVAGHWADRGGGGAPIKVEVAR